MATLQINRCEFYYELHGQGQPLVLVAGYAADHEFWTPILPLLSAHFQVLVFDNRAIGQTIDKDHFPLTAKIMADDVMALIQALRLEKPHVVGQSMGGTIVQSLAARYPDHINKLAILNSAAKWRQAMLLGIKSLLSERHEKAGFNSMFESILAWVYGEAFLQNPKHVRMVRTMILKNPYPPSLADQERQYAALVEFDGRADLKKIKAPTLVVSGTQDILSLPHDSEAIAAGIPKAKLVELNCGHGITGEMPYELAKLLLDFLKI